MRQALDLKRHQHSRERRDNKPIRAHKVAIFNGTEETICTRAHRDFPAFAPSRSRLGSARVAIQRRLG